MRLRPFGSAIMVAAVLALPPSLAAQVAIGGGAGVTFSTFGGDDVDDDDLDSRTGFYIGGSVAFPLGGILGLSTGAYYVQKGAEDNSDLEDGAIELAYLELPVLLQVQATGPDRPVGVSLFGGPSLGFNLSCDATATGGEIEISGDCSDSVKSFDLGALFGAGLSFQAGETATVTVNGGLDLGLTSIDDSDGEEEDVKNQTYFFGVGVSWPMGG